MISLQRYDEFCHKEIIVGWLLGHGLNHGDIDDFPSLGYVAYVDSGPVAVLFLRICEKTMAIVEGLTTNKTATSIDRHCGINDALAQLISDARTLGVKRILAYSEDIGTLVRSEAHGFRKLPHVLIGLNLGE